MDGGRLTETDAPAKLIEALGPFAVDDFQAGNSRYFASREEAAACLAAISGPCTLRDTTLEDVFLERVGRKLA